MITEITRYLKDNIPAMITTVPIQSGYLADMRSGIDLRQSAVLLELRQHPIKPKRLGWNEGQLVIRLWILVMIAQSYEAAIEETQNIIGGDDPDGSQAVSLYGALDQLKKDPAFSQMSGTFAGKEWRILTGSPIEYGKNTQFGVSTVGSQQVSSATVEITVNIEQRA